jgi:hypothetical protein
VLGAVRGSADSGRKYCTYGPSQLQSTHLPKSSVSDKVEALSSQSLAMAAAMQHANTAPTFLAAWNAAPDHNARQALE